MVKKYKQNDQVTVTAKTDTGYYKLADSEFIHGDYLSTTKITQQQPSGGGNSGSTGNGNSGSTGNYEITNPYTGGYKEPPNDGWTKVGNEESYASKYGDELRGYWIETEGGRFWFCENYGYAYKSIEDAINLRSPATGDEVFPSRHVDFSDIHVS